MRSVIFASVVCGSIIFDIALLSSPVLLAQEQSLSESSDEDLTSDYFTPNKDSKADKLIQEAQDLFIIGRPIDARAKLQLAVQADPKNYTAFMFLGNYYISEEALFVLGYRHLKTAEKLFMEAHGSDLDGTLDKKYWQDHAKLLALLTEAELNLDKYDDALKTIERFGMKYWDTWYPGTKAWLLMKLKRIDEAITAAQGGLLRVDMTKGRGKGRILNVLGILFSIKDNRPLALDAFKKAIEAEKEESGPSGISTPLNNAGEVYRELFREPEAEAAWIKSIEFSGGCEHVLPSLNLAILYQDQLRLFAATRVLNEFESCFKSKPTKSDSEHRTLLSLGKGKILLREGDVDEAIKQISFAIDREQWFGTIGTDAVDVYFAATVAMALALEAKANFLKDTLSQTMTEEISKQTQISWLELRSWWLKRKARIFAVKELNNFEDLWIRHTDTMLEYPTLGNIVVDYPFSAISKRLDNISKSDQRMGAELYYNLFRAGLLIKQGDNREAENLLKEVIKRSSKIERLLQAEAYRLLITSMENQRGWFSSLTEEQENNLLKFKEALFELQPSSFRIYDLSLPISISTQPNSSGSNSGEVAKAILAKITSQRFKEQNTSSSNQKKSTPRYSIELTQQKLTTKKTESTKTQKETANFSVSLIDNKFGRNICTSNNNISLEADSLMDSIIVKEDSQELGIVLLANNFIKECFKHFEDPKSEPLVKLEILGESQ